MVQPIIRTSMNFQGLPTTSKNHFQGLPESSSLCHGLSKTLRRTPKSFLAIPLIAQVMNFKDDQFCETGWSNVRVQNCTRVCPSFVGLVVFVLIATSSKCLSGNRFLIDVLVCDKMMENINTSEREIGYRYVPTITRFYLEMLQE